MDQSPLVNEQIQDGKQLLERLAEEGVAIAAACWLKESESTRWHLYIASSLVPGSGGKRNAYRRIRTLIQQMPQPFWIDPFDVKAVAANSPLGKAVQELIRSSNGRLPIHCPSGGIGGISIDGGFVYPPIAASVQQR